MVKTLILAITSGLAVLVKKKRFYQFTYFNSPIWYYVHTYEMVKQIFTETTINIKRLRLEKTKYEFCRTHTVYSEADYYLRCLLDKYIRHKQIEVTLLRQSYFNMAKLFVNAIQITILPPFKDSNLISFREYFVKVFTNHSILITITTYQLTLLSLVHCKIYRIGCKQGCSEYILECPLPSVGSQ